MPLMLTSARIVSALIFLSGAMAMVCAAAYLWTYFLILTAEAWGPLIGFAVLFATIWAKARYWEWIVVPWRLWHTLWRQFHRMVEATCSRRIRRVQLCG